MTIQDNMDSQNFEFPKPPQSHKLLEYLARQYIRHPQIDYAAFPYDRETNLVDVAFIMCGCDRKEILQTMDTQTEMEKPTMLPIHRGLTTEELQDLCDDVKRELSLIHCKPAVSSVWDVMKIHEQDLPRVYDIVNAVVKRGIYICPYDGMYVTFNATHRTKYGEITVETHQNVFLQQIQDSLKSLGTQLTLTTMSVPFYRDDFWIIQEGKDFAKEFRKYFDNTTKTLYTFSILEYAMDKAKGKKYLD